MQIGFRYAVCEFIQSLYNLGMAEQHSQFTYYNIELYKSESLGSGSYGGVCKAKCDGLLCAAKIMHPTLFDLRDPGTTSYLRKFQEECHLLSLARHPNVVQYLATYNDPDTLLPVLLMELCDESLTAFLERSTRPLSYHVELNICHDITLALVYLHSNSLIHRDLTGNNVLMIAGTRAKITDFGMSKLAIGNPRMTSLTLCPGNVLYMSPEALDEAKSYTAKLDIFSFGVIVIQILTRQFPNPTDRFQNVHDPRYDKEVRLVVPETERRQTHLQLISDTHSLKPLALQCLKKETLRPSAPQLSGSMSELKQAPWYAESVYQAQNSSEIQRLVTRNQELEQQLQHQKTLTEAKRREASEKDRTISYLHQSILHYEREIRELKQHDVTSSLPLHLSLTARKTQAATAVSPVQKDISKMTWREGKKAPERMERVAAVVHGNTAYFRPAGSVRIYSYHNISGKEQWSRLPDNPNKGLGLAVIDGLLTSVGGTNNQRDTNTLFSLTEKGKKEQWFEIFPPMPTARRLAACITTKQALVVAGGKAGSSELDTVEVMDINEKQWTTVCPLQEKLAGLLGIASGDSLYLAGGIAGRTWSKSVFTCSISDLWQPKTLVRQRSVNKSNVWRILNSLPVVRSTLVLLGGHLLAVGGRDDLRNPTNEIYRYDFQTDLWHVITYMKNKRSMCHAVTLPEDRLIVVGGYTGSTTLDSVEILGSK